MAHYDYWVDSVDCAVNEIDGLELTPGQIGELGAAMAVSAEMERECSGPPIEPGYSALDMMKRDYERKIERMTQEQDRVAYEQAEKYERNLTSMRWQINDLKRELEEARRG